MKWKTLHISLTCSYICIIFKSIKGFDWRRWQIRIQFTKKLTPVMQHIKTFFFTKKKQKTKDGIWTFKASQCQPHWSLFNGHNFIFCSGNIGNGSCDDANILYLYSFSFNLILSCLSYKNKARLPTYLPKNSCIHSFTFNKLISQTADHTSLEEWSTGIQDGVWCRAAQKRPVEPELKGIHLTAC